MDHFSRALPRIATQLGLTLPQIEAAVELLESGNTVPFITRYRKERTGGLDEEQIRNIQTLTDSARQVADRAEAILKSIGQQGKLTPQLQADLEQADTLNRLEDLYLPYKPRRRSRADAARERGLEPLADQVWQKQLSSPQFEAAVRNLVGAHADLPDRVAVVSGVQDILAESIAEHLAVREIVREVAQRTGQIQAKFVGKDEAAATFEDYAEFCERTSRVPPHRVLALNRGEAEKALRIKVVWDDERVLERSSRLLAIDRHPLRDVMQDALVDALNRLIGPSIEREIRRELTDAAARHAIEAFSRNLRSLLLQPPLQKSRVLAIDPGFRTGCKVAALSEHGELLATDVLYLTGSADKLAAIRRRLADLVRKHDSHVIAIGNGTGSREAEQLVAETISEHELSCRYSIVNEAGASIYSASNVARDEFPEHDATVRGTVSIGRRLQDPLSELVKIEPQHVGVGMYQHDLDEKQLKLSLDSVVESCVNYVGVNLNSASAALLQYVSGLNATLAQRVVTYRAAHGAFQSRSELLDVPGIGNATFTQAAGFLRIPDGTEPLDNTWIHPESYSLTHSLMTLCDIPAEIVSQGVTGDLHSRLDGIDPQQVAEQLKADLFTVRQIIESLMRPGRDPREELPGPVFRSSVLSLDDLVPGMELTGVVRNVVDFGAFIDVGLKDSGLVHISQMSREFIKSPFDVVSVGDVVTVWVLQVDRARKRIGLTMLPNGPE